MNKFLKKIGFGVNKKVRTNEEINYINEVNDKIMYWKSSLGNNIIF